MKRSLMAVLLVVTLVMSCVCSVGAATMTKDAFFESCKTLEREVVVPVDIAGMKDGGSYGDKIIARADDDASFKATIVMENVKDIVDTTVGLANANLEGDELDAFMALPVEGEFEITATWTGVTAPDDVLNRIPAGFVGLGDIFEVTETEKTADNSVRAKIEVKDGIVVTNLADLPMTISLEVDGFTVIDDGEMNATISGTTKIVNGLTDSYDVTYNFKDSTNKDPNAIKPVVIDVRTSSSGGGAATTTYYTVTFDYGDGETDTQSVVEGKVFELTKVPEKEGYAFDGWYSDAELTNKITSIVVNGDVSVYAGWTPIGEGGEVAHPVPDALNGDDHFAYLQGYPDGTIRPTANITRAEVATVFFRLLKAEVRQANLATTNSFADVSDDAWYNTAVSTMAKMGIINGRTATEFAPDEYITRAEFATICARFDDADEKCEDCNFTDINGHWAEDYILEAVAYKWIAGYEDSTFRPDNFINRAEATTLINRVLVRLPEDADALLEGMKTWPDNAENAWYYIAIQEATNSHTYGRVDAVNEQWNTLSENTDWSVYED